MSVKEHNLKQLKSQLFPRMDIGTGDYPLRDSKPSKAQAQIYAQIFRGLTDVLSEYELIGDMGSDSANNFAEIQTNSLFPAFLQQGMNNLSASAVLEEDNRAQGSNEKLKEALVKSLVTKRVKLQQLY